MSRRTMQCAALKPLIVIALIVMVGLLVVLISPFFLFALEDDILKNELDNAYINDGYPDWHEVNIDPIGSLLLPGSWSISQNENTYFIRENNDAVIAHAAIFGTPNSAFDSYKSFLYTIIGELPDSVEFTSCSDFTSINLSNFGILTARLDSQEIEMYYLLLYSGAEHRMLMVFLEDYDFNRLLEIAQAISYSQFILAQ